MPIYQRINRVLAIRVCKENLVELVEAGCSVRHQGGTFNVGKEKYAAEYGDTCVVNNGDWFVRDLQTGKGVSVYDEEFDGLYTIVEDSARADEAKDC